jgi:hypothetical protein
MLAEPLRYETKMTRCEECGMAFPSAYQGVIDTVTLLTGRIYTETCPAGHVLSYKAADYYLV